MLVIAAFGCNRLLKFAMTKESFIRFIDKIVLKLPAAGDLITKSNLANFVRLFHH